jgi:hypothetical protein
MSMMKSRDYLSHKNQNMGDEGVQMKVAHYSFAVMILTRLLITQNIYFKLVGNVYKKCKPYKIGTTKEWISQAVGALQEYGCLSFTDNLDLFDVLAAERDNEDDQSP